MDRTVQKEIARKILTTLYEAWDTHQIHASLFPIRDESGYAENLFDEVVDRLDKERGLIKDYGSWYTYEITPDGINFVEDNGLVPSNIVEQHHAVRKHILDYLANVYEQQGHRADVSWENISDGCSAGEDTLLQNLTFLQDLGLVEDVSSSSFRITLDGIRHHRGSDYHDDII